MSDPTTTPTIRLERTTPQTARIVFSNPPVNLVVPETIVALRNVIAQLEQDQDIKVVVLESDVPDFFFNHYDGAAAADLPQPEEEGGTPVWTDMVLRLSKAPFVSISLIRGRARGAGNELALATDLRYASLEKSFFSQPEVGIAILPGGGGAERLPRAIGRDRGLEAILASHDYPADIAERWGWVTRALPDDELDAFVDAMVARLASFDRDALGAAKAMVNRATLPPDADLVSAFGEFSDSLTKAPFLDRSVRLGGLVAEHGLDVEYRLGDFLGLANQTS
jgi:enoyl-CoA hydratase/carnithine racemase